QHPQLLGLGCTQFPERFADSMFRAVEARFGRRAFGGCAPISRGLLSLALPFRRVGLGALCSCELGLEVCFLLTGSRRPWPATCSLRFRRTRPPCHAARPGSTSISVSPRSWSSSPPDVPCPPRHASSTPCSGTHRPSSPRRRAACACAPAPRGT